MTNFKLPYMDLTLKLFARGREDIKTAFGRHHHYGFWEKPEQANGSLDDFVVASERMSEEMTASVQIENAQKVLDVGCGFGGTVAHINERFCDMSLYGLNIDARQLAIAKKNVVAQNNNTVAFVQGTAVALPFPDGFFDRVMAVECIFHFPSREAFFKEAYRVLKPGGILCISDFVAKEDYTIKPLSKEFLVKKLIELFWGKSSHIGMKSYQGIAAQAKFKQVAMEDITANILPTFAFVMSLLKRHPIAYFAMWEACRGVRLGSSYYYIYTFLKD